MHGHDLFQTHCGACHYDRRDAALHGPSLLGVYKKPSLPSGAPANDERVTATILHGHGLMPAVRDSWTSRISTICWPICIHFKHEELWRWRMSARS